MKKPLPGADPGILEKGGGGPVRRQSAPGKAAKPRIERRRRERRWGVWKPPPENCEKLDAISCNLAYIFGIRMVSDIIQIGPLQNKKNSSGHDFETHRY